jgi:hypothetical protein
MLIILISENITECKLLYHGLFVEKHEIYLQENVIILWVFKF